MVLALMGPGCTKHLIDPRPLPPIPTARRVDQVELERIERAERRLQGPLATGGLGDFRLQNDHIAVVVAGIGQPLGGSLVDGCPRQGGADSLRSLTPVIGRSRVSAPRFERLELEELGGTATLRLIGVDDARPLLRVTHEYTLHPGSHFLRITTTVKNRGTESVLQYRIGDHIDWGATLPFAPGLGRLPGGTPSMAWIAGWSDHASYAYYRRGATMSGRLGPQISTVVLETLELPPGREAVVQRRLAIAKGGQIAGLLPAILESQGVTAGRLDVTVRSETGDPLQHAALELELNGKPFTVGRTDDQGVASIDLPAGQYQVRAHTAARSTRSASVGIRPERTSTLSLTSSPPSRLVFEVHEEGSTSPFPTKLAVFGIDGTPTPWLGPVSSDHAANTLISATGKGVLPLPPGSYRVVLSHGPEFTLHTETIRLAPTTGVSLVARLQRVVSTTGYLGVDTDQRTFNNPGCSVSPRLRVLSNRVEGVDVAISADLDHATSLVDGASPDLVTITGVSHRARHVGPTSMFPVAPGGDPPPMDELLARGHVWRTLHLRWGTSAPLRTRARLPRSAPGPGSSILQLTGTRRPNGLFQLLDYDPNAPVENAIPPALTALQILDGQHPEDFDATLQDWLSQLGLGRKIVATGGSGSRAMFGGEAGYPRTYVPVPRILPPDQVAAQIVTAIGEGRAVVSSGPFITLQVNGAGPGSTIPLPLHRGRRGEVTVEVAVWAPAWIGLDSLTLFVNGKPLPQTPITGRTDGQRLQQSFKIPITSDSFIVGLVRGSSPLTPVVNSPGSPLLPLALTNPIWIDTDGNGRYDSRAKPR